MADEFTDSDDERAVEDVISQAMDYSVLEQIATINCSSFSTSGNLPSDLENRFRKLKSFPTGPPSKSKSFTPHDPVDFERIPDLKKLSEKSSPFTDDPEERSDGNRCENKGTNSKSELKCSSNSSKKFRETKSLKSKSKSRTDSSGSSSSSTEEYSDGNPDEKKGTDSKSSLNSKKFCESKSLKLKPKTASSKWRSDSWSVSSESRSVSPSPPRRGIGCLWCSPKKEKRKENRGLSSFSSSWGNEYEYEYDVEYLKTFSMKEQKKIMRMAMKEEEKINKEAEKIVKWAKQASARMMDVSGLDDELTDHEK